MELRYVHQCHGNVVGMQRTYCEGRTMVAGVLLVVVIELECSLCDAQQPAAAATDTTNCEINLNLATEPMARGADLSGHGVHSHGRVIPPGSECVI